MAKIIFKSVTANQVVLFPENIGDRIPENHPVRLVNQVIDKINIDSVLSGYKGGCTSSFHPRVIIKILFYSYFNNIYSARKIEKALHENIYFMWISGNSQPNFRTINLFRSKRLKNQIDTLFVEVVKLIAEMGYISLNKQFIDGTKIESAANKYTFVWRGSTEKYKEKLEVKIKYILTDIESAIKEDNSENNPELKEIDSQELASKIEELNHNIDRLNKKQKRNLKQLQNDHLPRLKKYENQLDTLGERKSFSKTDPDATFMRMKEDHMQNGQLKPAYNAQISTENQFLTNYTIHQRPGDTGTLIPHLEQFYTFYSKQSKQVIADSGYGSEENYEYMQGNDIEAFVKYNYFHKEQKRKFKNDIFHAQNFFYNTEKDYFVCPMGQHLEKTGTGTRTSDLGYVSEVTYYLAKRCDSCPLRWACHKSKTARRIEVNHKLLKYKALARERLLSEDVFEQLLVAF